MKQPLEIEPALIEAGDTAVLVNGRALPVRFRIISEDNYATLYNYALLWLNHGGMEV